jgi:hypothetical protein
MSSEVKTYDPSQVSLIVGGTIIKSWNKVSVVKDEDSWTFSAGTSGEVTRTKNLNRLGTITVTLPQTSADNGMLSAFAVSGALLSCIVKDGSGRSLHVMPEGTVVKPADSEYGKESGEREWSIKGSVVEMTVGGN